MTEKKTIYTIEAHSGKYGLTLGQIRDFMNRLYAEGADPEICPQVTTRINGAIRKISAEVKHVTGEESRPPDPKS